MSELVPFGKYKGQPIEALAADPSYLEWLQTQPWFHDRYPNLHTIVINNFRESDETPEHNKLQAKFLDKDFQIRAFISLRPRATADVNGLIKARFHGHGVMLAERLQEKLNALSSAKDEVLRFDAITRTQHAEAWDKEQQEAAARMAGSRYNFTPQAFDDYLARKIASAEWHRSRILSLTASAEVIHAQLEAFKLLPLSKPSWFFGVEFESKGIDVVLEVSAWADCPHITYKEEALTEWREDTLREWKFSIELKPSLGDDYPAVLRQMRASGSDVLLVGEFRSVAITLEQLRQIFETANCRVITLEDLENVRVALEGTTATNGT